MRQYIIRRVLISIGVLFGVSILLYALVRSMPGDYIQTTFAGNPNVTEAMIQNLRKLYGLDTGIVDRKSTRQNSSHIRRSRMPSSA